MGTHSELGRVDLVGALALGALDAGCARSAQGDQSIFGAPGAVGDAPIARSWGSGPRTRADGSRLDAGRCLHIQVLSAKGSRKLPVASVATPLWLQPGLLIGGAELHLAAAKACHLLLGLVTRWRIGRGDVEELLEVGQGGCLGAG